MNTLKIMKQFICLLLYVYSFSLSAQSGQPITKDQIKDRSTGLEGLKNGYQTEIPGWIIRIGDTLDLGRGSLPRKDFAFLYENPGTFGGTVMIDNSTVLKYLPSSYSAHRVIVKNLGISGNQRVGFGIYAIIGVGTLTRYFVEMDNAIEAGEVLPPPQFRKSNNQVSTQPVSVADELLKLKQLLDAGVINQSEFDTQKKKLLNQ